MNNVSSVVYGWGVLIVAAGGAYYYAKKDIDQRRRENFRDQQLQATQKLGWEERLRQQEKNSDEMTEARRLRPENEKRPDPHSSSNTHASFFP
ncbi:MAG: hypothetical protein DHS80DRAFT_30783 [Piptocephalis tieghemiana]|nr:MAG: hypothetical protein DHS80DRAFT_30783 [Piptocephalis tieghemiana]